MRSLTFISKPLGKSAQSGWSTNAVGLSQVHKARAGMALTAMALVLEMA